ncbi:general secretion pathway protein L [Alcanivorax sp. 521-1]|uniref:General secretion pathway protein L n=1 Tax=Alloalcanivorax profundimaris TaxID=2735259 RepID=A0ABS0ATU6_9GAMM|nr:general secretion pathway protein L [Alloalcanivorax profundimaris]
MLYQAGAGETPERLTLAQALNERAGAAVDLVVTSAEALLTGVTLSRKQARHLQRVLPYLLEEQLLEPPEALWFATGKAEHGRYPVAVINREALEALLAACREAGVRAARLRVDADLLAPETPVLITVDHWGGLILERDQALVADADQREALIALHHDEERPFTRLEDDLTLCDRLRAGLAADRGVEVLQGAYATRQSQRSGPSPWAPWKPVAGLAAAVFLIALAAVWAQQWRYQQAADQARRRRRAVPVPVPRRPRHLRPAPPVRGAPGAAGQRRRGRWRHAVRGAAGGGVHPGCQRGGAQAHPVRPARRQPAAGSGRQGIQPGGETADRASREGRPGHHRQLP